MEKVGAAMTLTRSFQISTPLLPLLATSLCVFSLTTSSYAKDNAAIFGFEIHYGDQFPGAPQKKADEENRLRMVTERLREHFKESGFDVTDIESVAGKAAAVKLEACSACASDLARDLGADMAVTGTVSKVSELVLSMNVKVYDAATAAPLTSAVVDMRGNTDESWRRAIDYLYKHLLSGRLEKIRK